MVPITVARSEVPERVDPTHQQCESVPIRVLFVEDDDDYRQIVCDELTWHGLAVCGFADGEAMLRSLDTVTNADVIVLDWRLPGISGIDLLTRLRQHGVDLPVVFLTSHAQIANERQAFERGAIDFMDKTRGVEVLVRRLRLVANKPHDRPEHDNNIVCGNLLLNLNEHRAYWREVDVGLTTGEYDIIHLLASSVGHYQTYRAIYDLQHYEGFRAGHGERGYCTNVRTSVKRIRKKFCQLDPTFAEIQTFSALGYRWRGLTAGLDKREQTQTLSTQYARVRA
jgi:two-component system response regulator ChvI